MKNIVQEGDGSLIIDSAFFDEFMEKNDLIDLTLTIERRNGQISILNPRISRNGLKEAPKEIGDGPRSKKSS